MILRYLLAALVLLGIGFSYGYLADGHKLFPYGLPTAIRGFFAGLEAPGELGDDEARQLQSLGYLRGYSPKTPDAGVTVHDTERSNSGLNLYTSGHGPEAFLIDMEGRVLHRWAYDVPSLWEGNAGPGGEDGYFRRAYAFDSGDLLAIYDSRLGTQPSKDILIKLDSESNLLWAYRGGAHHDLDVQPDGRIYVLTLEITNHPDFRGGARVVEDFITILDSEGHPIKRVSLLQALRNSTYEFLLRRGPEIADVLHTNTLEVLDGKLAGRADFLKAGNVLVSFCHLDAIAVVDMEQERVVWAMLGMWHRQHQPTLLDSGRMLLFDNEGHHGRSKVIEFDPLTHEIVWRYEGEKPDDFYSVVCGSNQRLANGNTLITESTRGRVIEVTPDKSIVWEFMSPSTVGDEGKVVAQIPELIRLDWTSVPPWAKAH